MLSFLIKFKSFILPGIGVIALMLVGVYIKAKFNELEQTKQELAVSMQNELTYIKQIDNLQRARIKDEQALKQIMAQKEQAHEQLQKTKQKLQEAYDKDPNGAGVWGNTVCPAGLIDGLCELPNAH